jgi:hypothetical protein
MSQILYYVLIFYVGISFGFMFKMWLYERTTPKGTIVVIKGDEKTTFLLELDCDPNDLEDKKEVLFKVLAPDSSLRDGNSDYNETPI